MTLAVGPGLGLFVNGDAGEGHYGRLMELFRGLDALVQPSVKSRVASLPTSGMADGDRYLVTGTGKIARWSTVGTLAGSTAGWEQYTPQAGWVVWSVADNAAYRYQNGSWAVDAGGSGGGGYTPIPMASAFTGSVTLTLANANTFRRLAVGGSADLTITIPTNQNVAFPIGTEIGLIQDSTGPLVIRPDSTVSLRVPPGRLPRARGECAAVLLKKLDTNYWAISGDLAIDPENSAPQPSYVNTLGADRTLTLNDVGDTLLMNSNTASSLTVTVPPQSSVAFPNSAEINIIQFGTSPVLIAAGSGVTIYKPAGFNAKVAAQFGALTLKRIAIDSWMLIGMMEAAS